MSINDVGMIDSEFKKISQKNSQYNQLKAELMNFIKANPGKQAPASLITDVIESIGRQKKLFSETLLIIRTKSEEYSKKRYMIEKIKNATVKEKTKELFNGMMDFGKGSELIIAKLLEVYEKEEALIRKKNLAQDGNTLLGLFFAEKKIYMETRDETKNVLAASQQTFMELVNFVKTSATNETEFVETTKTKKVSAEQRERDEGMFYIGLFCAFWAFIGSVAHMFIFPNAEPSVIDFPPFAFMVGGFGGMMFAALVNELTSYLKSAKRLSAIVTK